MSDIDITVSVVDLALSFLIGVIMILIAIDFIPLLSRMKAFQKSFIEANKRLNTVSKQLDDMIATLDDKEKK